MNSLIKRHILLGDIHGCHSELLQLLQKIQWNAQSDLLLSVGDLVHKGPGSEEVLRFFMEGGHQAILGNHERHLLQSLRGEREEYALQIQLAKNFGRDRLISWLESLPLWYEGENFVAVHAGFLPWEPRAEAHEDFCLVNLRYTNMAEREWTGKPRALENDPEGKLQAWYLNSPSVFPEKKIIFGHWASPEIRRGERSLGIDTGCCYGGRLTAWIAEQDQLISVPSQQAKQFDY